MSINRTYNEDPLTEFSRPLQERIQNKHIDKNDSLSNAGCQWYNNGSSNRNDMVIYPHSSGPLSEASK